MTVFRRLTIFFLVVVFSFLQTVSGLELYGIRPNLILILFVVLSVFLDSLLIFLSLLLLAVIISVNIFFFSWPVLIILLLGLISFFWTKRLPWHTGINIVAGIIIFSVVFSVLISPSLFFENLPALLQELVYNVIIGFVLYSILVKLFSNENRSLRVIIKS